MILDIDAGNSRFKWRVRAEFGAAEIAGASEYDEMRSFVEVLKSCSPDRVCLGSVVREDKYRVLMDVLSEFYVGAVERVAVDDLVGGLKLAYRDVATLGVDRWLAMLASCSQFPGKNLLVVDCGSAITLDLVSADGLHQGGYIVPGFNLMRHSLFLNTDRVKVAGEWRSDSTPGVSTAEAVDHGLLRMVGVFIADIVHEQEERQLIITGGDGKLLAGLVGCNGVYVADLVLDGIAQALPK